MLFLLFAALIVFAVIKGFFKYILPVLLILFVLRMILGGLMLLFSPHFWGALLVVAFFVWLIGTVKRQRRY
nr:hypothetical protein [Lactococcus nasutitermitis]